MNRRNKLAFISIIVALLILSTASAMIYGKIAHNSNTKIENYSGVPSQLVKNMVFYLHNDTISHLIFDYSTTYIFDTHLGNRVQNNGDIQRVRLNFYLFPQLAGDLRVKGNLTVGIYINTTGVSANANLYAILYDVKYKSGSTTNEVLVGSGGPASYTITTGIDYYEVTIPNIDYTFNASDSIRLYVEIQGGASSYFDAWYGNQTYDARVVIPCANSMNINTVKTKNSVGNYTTIFDPYACNKTLAIEVNMTDPFGRYDVRDVNVTILDPNGTAVVNNESMRLVSGTPRSYFSTYMYAWNYSNHPKGKYDVIVWALDNNGYYYYWHFEQYNYGPYDVIANAYFVIGFKYNVHVWIYDSFGKPLNNALVYLVESSGVITDYNRTNQNGYTRLLAYNGTYTLKVFWNDNLVTWNSTEMFVNNNRITGNTVTVHGESTIRVYSDVGDIEIRTLDFHDVPVRSALIFVGFPNSTYSPQELRTNESGYASLGYSPGGEYYLSVYWKNVKVYSGHIIVHFSTEKPLVTLNITTAIYYLTMQILNNKNVGMPYLEVVFYDSQTQLVEEVGITDASGTTTVRLPAGDKDIVAYFQDQVVYEIKDYSLKSDANLRVYGYFYTVNLHVVDSHDISVPNATVLVLKENRVIYNATTDINGDASLTLIKGNYSLKIIWLNSEVINRTKLVLSGNVSFTITANIYYLDIKLLGNDGKPVSGTVVISKEGKPLYTQKCSDLEVRLPVGDYVLNATISKNMYLTGVKESISKNLSLLYNQNITLAFKEYPVNFVSSNLFYVILGYVVLALVILGVLWQCRRRKSLKQEKSIPEEKTIEENLAEEKEEKEEFEDELMLDEGKM